MHRFAGIYTPLVTPFAADGSLDARALARNVERYLRSPLTGLVVLGSNGEAPQLEEDEADRAIETVRDAMPKDRPLLAGTGRESTAATIAATERAAALGVDAVMVRTPSFYKAQMTTDAFVRHYTQVADRSPVPVLLYNVTIYTGVNLLPDAVGILSEHPNIVGIKETGNDMVQFGEYLARAADGFTVLAGSGATYYSALTLGAHGADPRRGRRGARSVRRHLQRRSRRPPGRCAAHVETTRAAFETGWRHVWRSGAEGRPHAAWLRRRRPAPAAPARGTAGD